MNSTTVSSIAAKLRDTHARMHTVLVVEDDPVSRLSLRFFFQRQGWHLLEATNISAALKLWAANQRFIDVVVTDYQLNEPQTGLDLATYVQGSRPGTPCFVISGTWTKEKCPRDEPDRHLYYRAKPFDYHELLPTINMTEPARPAKTETESSAQVKDWRSIAAHPPKFR